MTRAAGPIGTLRESPLHAALKARYAQPDDEVEARVQGYWIDLRRPGPAGHDLLIEVQTGNFGALKAKLAALRDHYRIHIVHPIPAEKWLVMLDGNGRITSRRRSPRKGRFEGIFEELVNLTGLFSGDAVTLEVVLTREEEIRQARAPRKRRWAKAYRSVERRLLDVLDWQVFESPADLLALLPAGLPQPFTNRELADAWHAPLRLAQRTTYTLCAMGALVRHGRQGRAWCFGHPDAHEGGR
ncbi:MAG: hypothetical protein K1X39_13340 [Thermoflexales bacterium]|nr:hypothetical protein [Thermoflexales bacterium]